MAEITSRERTTLLTGTMVAASLLYGLTCAFGVLWQDSAMFQHRVFYFDLRGESGLPLAHPLYIILAKTFTFFGAFPDVAQGVNLFSALCGALTLLALVQLLMTVTRSRLAAIIGTTTLAVSHTFWTHSAIAEVYNLYALGLVIELVCIERFLTTRKAQFLGWALFVNGLNASNHLLAILHAPIYAAIVVWAIRAGLITIKKIPLYVALFVIGATPYVWLIVENILGGQGVFDAMKEALVGPPERAGKVLDTSFSIMRQASRSATYFAMNFPTPMLLLAIVGLWNACRDRARRSFVWVLAGIFIINFVFAFRYTVPDQFVFFTPDYVIVAVLIGIGAGDLIRRMQRGVGTQRINRLATVGMVLATLMPIAVYAAAPSLMRKMGFSIGAKRDIPFRDTLGYFIQPWKCMDHSAQQFADAALQVAAPDGLLYADTTIKNVLVYVRDVQGKERGVTLTTGHDTIPKAPVIDRTPEAVEPFVKAGKAYICSDAPDYVPDWIRERWDLEPAGIIFKIVQKKPR